MTALSTAPMEKASESELTETTIDRKRQFVIPHRIDSEREVEVADQAGKYR
jgi:hypothetical protein